MQHGTLSRRCSAVPWKQRVTGGAAKPAVLAQGAVQWSRYVHARAGGLSRGGGRVRGRMPV